MNLLRPSALLCLLLFLTAADPPELKVGIIGLDTSHAPNFTKELNNPKALDDVSHCRVVAAFPKGAGSGEFFAAARRSGAYFDPAARPIF